LFKLSSKYPLNAFKICNHVNNFISSSSILHLVGLGRYFFFFKFLSNKLFGIHWFLFIIFLFSHQSFYSFLNYCCTGRYTVTF
jgi:hypothetical protein